MTNTASNTAGKTAARPCIECTKSFTYEPVMLFGKEIVARPRCPVCTEAAAARHQAQVDRDLSEQKKARWEKVCPPIYRDTDPARIDQECVEAATRWDVKSPRGLGMLGSTGIGKTRAAFIALRRAFDAGLACRAVSHNSFTRTVQTAFAGDGREREDAKALLDAFQRCDVLLLDDLGKPPPTERADAELEELVEVRTCNMKPILWSANGSAGWLIKRMGNDRGEPLVRRLSEFCDIITVRGSKQQDPEI